MTVLCVFGASTTWGAWDKEKGGWVNRLRLFLEKNDYDIDVYNMGVSGDNTNDLLERFEVECKARIPTTIMFSLGDNDSAKGSKVHVPIDQFEENLNKLIKLSKKFTNKIIFVGTKGVDESRTNPVSWDSSVSYKLKNLEEYDKIVQKICIKNSIPYVSIPRLKNEDFEDGVHPNEKGHEKIFLKVKDFLVKELT